MKVAELIEKLRELPQDVEVRYVYDGASRGDVDLAWLARGGHVCLVAFNDMVAPHDRPASARTTGYWYSPKDPSDCVEVRV